MTKPNKKVRCVHLDIEISPRVKTYLDRLARKLRGKKRSATTASVIAAVLNGCCQSSVNLAAMAAEQHGAAPTEAMLKRYIAYALAAYHDADHPTEPINLGC